MSSDLYLVEQLERQNRRERLNQFARNRAIVSATIIKRSQTMKRTKQIIAAALVAAALAGAAPQASTALRENAPVLASLCCYIKR